MEDTLRVTINYQMDDKYAVLILFLMEDTLRVIKNTHMEQYLDAS